MVAIPFPLSSSPAHYDQVESQGRLINLFSEALGEQRGAKRIRVPGMTEFLTSSETGFRGMFLVGSTLYMAYEDVLMRGTSAGGAMTTHAALSGTTPVYFARNNKSPTPDKVVVSENGAFTIVDAGTINAYPDVDLPQPNSCFSLDGYIVFTLGDGRAFDTAVYALSFSTAEAKPDGLVRGVAHGGRAFFFVQQSLEIWTNVGSSPFPFQRAAVVPFGLIGPDAVAGWEDGFGSGLLWVADD